MNRKLQSMLKQQWTNRLLALFMCASLLLSSVAARPLAQSYDQAPPTPTSTPAADTATPVPASPTPDQATATAAPATPTAEQASPTAEPPSPTVAPATPTAEPATPAPTEVVPTQTPAAPVKPAAPVNPKVVSGVNFHQLVFKFKNGYASAFKDKSLSAQSSPGLAPLLDLLKGAPVKPLFNSLSKVSGLQAAAQTESVLSRYYFAQLPASTDFAGAQAILDSVKSLPFIDTAYMEPIYKPASTTPDFTPQQGYLGSSSVSNGIEASTYAWNLDGGRGLGVKVFDIEQGWQIGHEDLPVTKSYLLDSANTSQQDWVDHGTAVLGVIGAVNNIPNSYGVTGIASDAELWMVSSIQDADLTPRSLADAINLAVLNGVAGDIIVLPLEALGPISEQIPDPACTDADNASFEDVPVEYWQANFDAISAATTAGLIVVEAAGNGQMNLSDDRYDSKFDTDSRDSGAIIVGAGTSDTRTPVCSTNYGSRVDLQGWGENVVTTGYGDIDPPGTADPNTVYTAQFGGTSAAAAIVAGAAADFLGVAKDRGYTLTPNEVRDALHSTGVAQDSTSAKHIGPLPNLKNAIEKKIPEKVTLLTPINGSEINTLRPTLDWESFYNASEYEVQIFRGSSLTTLVIDDTTHNSIYTVGSNLTSGTTYYWQVRPMVDSVWLDWSDPVWSFRPIAVSVTTTSLDSPSDGSVFNHPADNPTFTWKVPTNSVDGYQIQISTASDFSAGPGSFDVDTNSYDGTTLDPNTHYYWRVRCRLGLAPPDPSANFGAWTSARSLYTSLDLVGALTSPADTTAVDSLRPLFTWTAVTSAKAYGLQVATSSSFSSSTVKFTATINIASGDTAPHNYYQMGSDLPRNSTLYWRVRDLGKYGWSAYTDYYISPAISITTGSPPGTPSQLQPSNGAVVTEPDDVIVRWTPPSTAVQFWLQISTISDFSTVIDVKSAASSYDAPLNSETKYYWRVRAGNGVPIWGNWSSTHTFFTTPPDPTNLVAPSSPTDSLTPTFDWDVIPEASSYRIEVLKFNDSTSTCTTSVVLDKTITSSPPYTLTSSLPRNTNLCWRLRAGGLFGFSNWTTDATDEITTPDPPYTPSLLSPSNTSALATFAPLLDWASSPNQTSDSRKASEYEVQVDSSPSFPAPVIDTIVPILTKLQLGPIDLVNAGTYYWRVRAHATTPPYDLYSSWSSTWSFITPPQFQGTIYDAMTTNPGPPDTVQSVNLNVSGTSWTTTTDINGQFSFRGLPPGTYDLQISKGNYMRQTRRISISQGNNIVQDFDIVPIPDAGQMRIQLTWGGSVSDMDSNLWLPKTDLCLINKNDLDGSVSQYCQTGTPDAEMVADDAQPYGTEVITIDTVHNTGTTTPYLFAVLLNAAASKMGGSQARVMVYYGPDLKGNFSVDSSANGIWWKVFKIELGTTEPSVTQLNTVQSKNPAPY